MQQRFPKCDNTCPNNISRHAYSLALDVDLKITLDSDMFGSNRMQIALARRPASRILIKEWSSQSSLKVV